ncbi:hypothetical protein Rsub_01463 [Raphidocelis subcapitata]|uniref:Peptidase S1 domain-containing protein n=1 Tax=Raphidocelis subcapitata TaxID=307507 RepID=A0A2V0NN49_9CHLO|nr:hypothetical protein Rsub_01463 [Raphidocelis subcapitata]|eukprot:GBF88964.1 hypothetical protein Rsub_01463 [Raphidocelis subcapitata]
MNVVHTKAITKAAMRRATQERSTQLTGEQVAAVFSAANDPVATQEAGVEGGATYAPQSGGAVPLAQGTSGFSFTDTRLAKSGSAYVPILRASGKLFFKIGTNAATYSCSASLIGKSLLLTAAQCVCGFGSNKLYTDHTFVPDYDVSKGFTPFKALKAGVPTSFLKGTDACASAGGVGCANDLAVLYLDLTGGQQAFQAAGNTYYNYLANAFDAVTAPSWTFYTNVAVPKYLEVSVLGYSSGWDANGKMQMSNSPAFQSYKTVGTKTVKNMVKGSSLGLIGAGGAPWIINLGVDATASNGATYGTVTPRNAIIGVNSYGWTDPKTNVLGACMFATNNEFPYAAYGIRGASNIGFLVDYACDSPVGWGMRAKGLCR